MSPVLRIIGYVSLLGAPHAVTLHHKSKGTGSELDGMPLSLVVIAEFLMRGAAFAVLGYALQEGVGRINFHRYELTFYLAALVVIGASHTFIYFLVLGLGARRWSLSSMQRLYRLGRNLVLSAVPGLFAALTIAWWQDMNHMPMYEGSIVVRTALGVWAVAAFSGFVEALIVKRVPTGLEEDTETIQSSKYAAP